MNKQQLEKDFSEDFSKTRGALNEVISNNRQICNGLLEDLSSGNFKQLEEFVEINKLILEATKGITGLYKETTSIIKNTKELHEEETKSKIDLESLMED